MSCRSYGVAGGARKCHRRRQDAAVNVKTTVKG
jgi:hypothetical protein